MARSSEFRQSWKAGGEAVQRHRLLLGFLVTVGSGIIDIARTLLNRGTFQDVFVEIVIFFVIGPLLVLLFHRIFPNSQIARDAKLPIHPED